MYLCLMHCEIKTECPILEIWLVPERKSSNLNLDHSFSTFTWIWLNYTRCPKKVSRFLIWITRKIFNRIIKIISYLKAESCSYLMVYARLKLNFFIKTMGGGMQKCVVFLPLLVRFPVTSLLYREYFTVGLLNWFLTVKIKLLTLFQH